VAATGAKVLAHAAAGHAIEGMFRGLIAGDIIKVGKTVELEALDTPGHTLCHICLLSHTDQPTLFSGDTLFNAGAGNCHNGGNLKSLFQTFSQQLNLLPENTLVYPGHDYIENNLQFDADALAKKIWLEYGGTEEGKKDSAKLGKRTDEFSDNTPEQAQAEREATEDTKWERLKRYFYRRYYFFF
jgi:glyoxylase-like metal-dependent hydrolase (beta-lactamase superfamily II)